MTESRPGSKSDQSVYPNPECQEDLDMQDGLPPVASEDLIDKPGVIPQTLLKGQKFNRYPAPIDYPQEKQVSIVASIDQNTGDTVFEASNNLPPDQKPEKNQLQQLPLDQAREHYDPADDQGPSLETIRKRGASIPVYDIKVKPKENSK